MKNETEQEFKNKIINLKIAKIKYLRRQLNKLLKFK